MNHPTSADAAPPSAQASAPAARDAPQWPEKSSPATAAPARLGLSGDPGSNPKLMTLPQTEVRAGPKRSLGGLEFGMRAIDRRVSKDTTEAVATSGEVLRRHAQQADFDVPPRVVLSSTPDRGQVPEQESLRNPEDISAIAHAKLVEAAVNAIGRTCVGEPRTTFKHSATDALISVANERKEDEVRFTAGESLVRATAGFDVPPPASLRKEEDATEADELPCLLYGGTNVVVFSHPIQDSAGDGPGSESAKPTSLEPELNAVCELCFNPRPHTRARGKFMDLASHSSLWNDRRGAVLAGSALLGNDLTAEKLIGPPCTPQMRFDIGLAREDFKSATKDFRRRFFNGHRFHVVDREKENADVAVDSLRTFAGCSSISGICPGLYFQQEKEHTGYDGTFCVLIAPTEALRDAWLAALRLQLAPACMVLEKVFAVARGTENNGVTARDACRALSQVTAGEGTSLSLPAPAIVDGSQAQAQDESQNQTQGAGDNESSDAVQYAERAIELVKRGGASSNFSTTCLQALHDVVSVGNVEELSRCFEGVALVVPFLVVAGLFVKSLLMMSLAEAELPNLVSMRNRIEEIARKLFGIAYVIVMRSSRGDEVHLEEFVEDVTEAFVDCAGLAGDVERHILHKRTWRARHMEDANGLRDFVPVTGGNSPDRKNVLDAIERVETTRTQVSRVVGLVAYWVKERRVLFVADNLYPRAQGVQWAKELAKLAESPGSVLLYSTRLSDLAECAPPIAATSSRGFATHSSIPNTLNVRFGSRLLTLDASDFRQLASHDLSYGLEISFVGPPVGDTGVGYGMQCSFVGVEPRLTDFVYEKETHSVVSVGTVARAGLIWRYDFESSTVIGASELSNFMASGEITSVISNGSGVYFVTGSANAVVSIESNLDLDDDFVPEDRDRLRAFVTRVDTWSATSFLPIWTRQLYGVANQISRALTFSCGLPAIFSPSRSLAHLAAKREMSAALNSAPSNMLAARDAAQKPSSGARGRDVSRNSLLHIAACADDTVTASLALARGARPLAHNYDSEKPLDAASGARALGVMRILLGLASVRKQFLGVLDPICSLRPLSPAVECRQLGVVRMLAGCMRAESLDAAYRWVLANCVGPAQMTDEDNRPTLKLLKELGGETQSPRQRRVFSPHHVQSFQCGIYPCVM